MKYGITNFHSYKNIFILGPEELIKEEDFKKKDLWNLNFNYFYHIFKTLYLNILLITLKYLT